MSNIIDNTSNIIDNTSNIIDNTSNIINNIIYDENLFKISMLRYERNQLLILTDRYVLIDYPISPDNLIIIKEYRQKLRDFTTNDYILPDKPDFIN